MARVIEQVDNRVLGAVCFVDAVMNLPVHDAVRIIGIGPATDIHFWRNQSGLYIIAAAPDLASHTAVFLTPPTTPPVGSLNFTFEVRDNRGYYLPRQFTIRLPRNPNPTAPDAIFMPIDVRLFPSPIAQVGSRWAVIRATVRRAGQGVGGALIRVERVSDRAILGRGLTDERGEVLIGIEGIPVTLWGEEENDEVVTFEVEARIRVMFDPAATGLPNPDTLETRSPSASQNVRLASGRTQTITLTIP